MQTVTGIGVECLYSGYPRDHEPSPREWTAEHEAVLDQRVAAGKRVLTIACTTHREQTTNAHARALARSYVPCIAERPLGRLRSIPGFEPDKDPASETRPDRCCDSHTQIG